MKFSQRTGWELSANRISLILERLKQEGRPILDLTESNPTRCSFFYPPNILTALAADSNLVYAPSPQGLLPAREAVCAYYQRRGIAVHPDQVFLTASTSEAYAFLFRLLGDPEDAILFPQPSYPLFQYLVDLHDLRMENYRLVYTDSWQVDLGFLQAAVHPGAKAVVVVNPNNPTGSSFSPWERQALAEICQQRQMALISDEVFLDYSFSPEIAIESFLSVSGPLTFVLGGVSKTMALPQMKLSWIILSGPLELVREAKERLEVIADTYLSVNTPAQNALPAWLSEQALIQGEVLNRIRKNRARIFATLPSGCECLKAAGGWYAVLKIPSSYREEEMVIRLLEEKQVFVHPGYFFDFEEGSFLVLSLLPRPEIFEQGLSQILEAL